MYHLKTQHMIGYRIKMWGKRTVIKMPVLEGKCSGRDRKGDMCIVTIKYVNTHEWL